MSINAALTTLAQRELGPGYLVRITDQPGIDSERVELLGYAPAIVDPGWEVFRVRAFATLTYEQMAGSELSICGQRRAALRVLLDDQLAAVA